MTAPSSEALPVEEALVLPRARRWLITLAILFALVVAAFEGTGVSGAMPTIAAELGYASASAFTAMVRRTLGAPPTQFFA